MDNQVRRKIAACATTVVAAVVAVIGFAVVNGRGHAAAVPMPVLGAAFGGLVMLAYVFGYRVLWRAMYRGDDRRA